MDQKISPQEIKSARLKKIRKFAIITVVIIAAIVIALVSIQPGVKKSNLVLSTVERGTLATTIPATGSVVPAFEEIINSPISTKII